MGQDPATGAGIPCHPIRSNHWISLRPYSFEDPRAKMLATNESTSAEQVSQ